VTAAPARARTTIAILVPTTVEATHLFGEGVGAELERRGSAIDEIAGRRADLALCGIGLAAAGTVTTHALGGLRSPPAHLMLAGIAGTYAPPEAPVGSALVGTFVRPFGIGIGSRSLGETGWAHLPPTQAWRDVDERLPLDVPNVPAARGGLLSVAAASVSREEAAERRARHPDVVAEEMEAFAVALAARVAGVPLTVVRGISNVAGVRDPGTWELEAALGAARETLEQVVESL
jgi:futalosine hydrolase